MKGFPLDKERGKIITFKERVIILLSTGGYVGYSPIAPGTVGSLWGIILGFFLSSLNPIAQGFFLLFGVFVASLLAGEAKDIFGGKDPGYIVCDEIIGFLVAIFLIPFTLFNVVAVFLLFRFFDILKPFPIRVIEERIRGGWGIVLDDVMAGLYANLSLMVLRWITG
ncbi:MAG: phosphatidylglycerophosphatase A [Deltaproteobacteria bacterium]|nr:phosphatidylglycerophosphatase A [Deltaproteobacteria bacterium]